MEGQRPEILIILLLTFSSALGNTPYFTFSQRAHEAVLRYQEAHHGIVDAENIIFYNLQYVEGWYAAETTKNRMDTINLIRKEKTTDRNSQLAILELGIVEYLSRMEIYFSKTSEDPYSTTIGFLNICFRSLHGHESCFLTEMYSPPCTDEGNQSEILYILLLTFWSALEYWMFIFSKNAYDTVMAHLVNEGKRRVILFTLLLTLSSVIEAAKFTFSKNAYEAIVRYQLTTLGDSFKKAEDIEFRHKEEEQEMVVATTLKQREDSPGLDLVLTKNPETVKSEISGIEKQGQEPERLCHISISFRVVTQKPESIISGTLKICFKEDKQNPHQSCFEADMFSPPKTKEDITYAETVAKELTPLSKDQVKKIQKGEPFKWSLSTLDKILSSDIQKVVVAGPHEEGSLYALKAIIVDKNLMEMYYKLANPLRTVKIMGL